MNRSTSPTAGAGVWPSTLRAARRVAGARGVAVVVRTAHLGAMAVLVGGRHFGVTSPAVQPWQLLTAATGFILLAIEASHSRHWIHQVRGVAVLAHVAAAALVSAAPGATRPAIAAAVIIGSVGSHLPRTIRKWSLLRRRVLDD
jgi:hypothetical protein